jgi:diguanylate cyclase (GGDEF)-like protein/PAS domain S-box-containing protein
MFQSIRLRLLGLVLAAVAPFAALIGLGIWDQWRTEQAQALQFAFSEARSVAAQVDDHIGNLENLLTGLTQAVSVNPADADNNDAILRRAMSEQPDYIANITLFGLDGKSIGIAAGSRYYAGDRLYFRNIIAGERLAIGEPVIGRATSGWIVTVARPVEDLQGNLRAVLTVGTRIEKLQDSLTPRTLPIGSVVRLVNESSIVISDGWNNLNANDRNHVLFDKGIRHIVAKDSALRMTWSDGIERITGTASTKRTRWIVSVGLPKDVAFAPVIMRLKWSLASSAGALSIAFVIAWMFSARIVRPLRQLTMDASTLAAGELSHRTKIDSKDEVGALADTFNQMAASLERRQDEVRLNTAEIQEANDTLDAVIDASPIAIVCTNLDHQLILWNHAAEQIYGYTEQEAVGHRVKIVPPEELVASQELYQRALGGEIVRDVEVKRQRKDGTQIDIKLAVSPLYSPNGTVRGVAWAHQDITKRKRAEAQLTHFAHYDQLTGLPNRLTMNTELGSMVGSESSPPTSIALFDLDGFKDVNDTLGHSTGDKLLIEVGQRLSSVTHPQHPPRVCRLGGDEFVAIIPNCGDPRVAAEVVGTMLERLAEPYEINEHVLHLSGSAGIAIAPNDGQTVDELIANADLALYQAKKSGGGIYRFFIPTLRAKAQSRRALDIELRRAFTNGEFELYYQPQVRLADGVVIGAEALLRWRHPERGLLAPGAFVDALAANPIAPEVGAWIARTACMQTAAWRAKGLMLNRIAVNLFSAHLHHASFIADIEEALAVSGLPSHVLELEIVENVALNNEGAAKPLHRLREKGVQLAFDDFGTGFASLSYLTLFPVTHIKIDRSFVAKVGNSARDAAIVRSLIAMAHSMELDVIAEGIETEAQAAFLLNEKCEEAQGYLYSKPLPSADFEAYLGVAEFAEGTITETGRHHAEGARPKTGFLAPPRRRKVR